MRRISVIVPVFNEAENLRELFAQLSAMAQSRYEVPVDGAIVGIDMADFDWEFLFVNDGSRDDSLERLMDLRKRDARVCVVNFSRNFGKEQALLAGMDYATGDAAVIMDADLQHPIEIIPQMVYWWGQGFDDVYGRRATRGQESWLRKKLSLSFYSLLKSTSAIDVLPNVGDFRLIDRAMLNAIRSLRETQRYTKGLYCWVGFKKKDVAFTQRNREHGASSFNLCRLLNLAIDGLTSFTTTPLRLSAIVGFMVSLVALVYLAVIVFRTLVYGEVVRGFSTLICSILLLGGFQLIALGIIGEYIGRIFIETKQRPPYIVESFYGKQEETN